MITKIYEHYNGVNQRAHIDFFGKLPFNRDFWCYFKKNKEKECFHIYSSENEKTHHLRNSYFVGIDWIKENEHAIYIQPKINKASKETNYMQMLLSALIHPEILSTDIGDFFEIKWEKPEIEISQTQDMITPLLIISFLKNVMEIVKKGLKKSYYKIENNLYCRIKGKLIVSQNIKKNHIKNKMLNNYCTYDEFGVNGIENRIIKKALKFIQSYRNFKNIDQIFYNSENSINIYKLINSEFKDVSDDVELHELKHAKTNPFFSEYREAVKLARIILRRFGYNIRNTMQEKISTPPFWIDMSKLFELYVLGLLKKRFGSKVDYHFSSSANELDYLLKCKETPMVIDAKYKLYHKKNISKQDIRQVSGYARLNTVYEALNNQNNELIDCLIIYPDQDNGYKSFEGVDLKQNQEKDYKGIYKLAVKLPQIESE